MKVVRWIFFIILGIASLIMVVSAFLPKEVRILVSTEINLPAYKVYHSLVNFSDYEKWNPWLSKDSTAKMDITRTDGIIGSSYTWTSENSGSGKMVLDSVVANKQIWFTLSFDGMNQSPLVWHELSEQDGKTNLGWGFYQEASYPVGRIFMALMKGKLTADYELGLANLKALLEEKGVRMSTLTEIGIEEFPGTPAVVITGKGSLEEIIARQTEIYTTLMAEIQKQGLELAGVPFIHYWNYDPATELSEFEAGFPVKKTGKAIPGAKNVIIPSFKALRATHNGPYDELDDSYGQIMNYIADNNIRTNMEAWEIYITDPEVEKDEMKFVTIIAFPVVE